MEIGLLRGNAFCPKCASPMKLCPRGVNKFVWRYHKAVCDKTISIYVGTPFAFAKIHLSKVVMLMFYFANEEPATKVRDYVKLSDKTITQWYDICCGYCLKEMIRIDMKVGGPGHVVEIDDTSLAKKQKYHRGKKYFEFWVFGGYDRSTRKWFAAITFHDRTKATLTAKIAECILPQ
ncbi:hypothetical protein ATCC90586_003248 [Pythium insidiosum]|nr:hypothetical protein ATCC90586_003248 [Pythium insidiosum]